MGKPIRVLMVEDSEDDSKLVVRELKRGGYEPVFERVETREAMAAALENQAWDIVISDYVMPHFNGPDALKLLQHSGLDLPFIIVSGKIGEDIAVAAMRAGAHDYIMKANLQRLAPAVERELGEAQVREERRQAEEALRKSEANLAEAQRMAHIGNWELDILSDRLTWSDEAYRIFGLKPQQFAETYEAFLENVHPDDRERVNKDHTESLRAKTPYTIVHRLLLKDGTVKYVEAWCENFYGDDGKPIRSFGTIQDITERMRAEEAAAQAEAQYRTVVENSTDGIVIVLGDRRVFVNRAFLEIYGLDDMSQALGTKIDEFILPEDREAVMERVRRVQKGEKLSGHPELRIRRPDGEIRNVQLSAAPIEYQGQPAHLAIVRDVTDLKEAEGKLRKQTHDLGERVKELNCLYRISSLCQVLDTSMEEILRKACDLLPPAWQYPEVTCGRILMGAQEFQTENFKETSWKQTASIVVDGERRGVVEVCYLEEMPQHDEGPFLKEERNLINAIAEQLGDTAVRKQAQEALWESNRRLHEALAELQQAQRQVIQQERLRALGQMASGVAHDFNNALMPMLGFADLLLERPETLDDKVKATKYLGLIRTAAQDGAKVVSRLREFYRQRQESEEWTPTRLNELVAQAISLTQPKWKDEARADGITINIETDLQKVPLVFGNETELREVMINLILNAVDAMPNGGTMILRTRSAGKQAAFEVGDSGTGMTEEVRQRCLEPFFTTKGKRGTGLGLSTVYGIINRHKGTIEIESEVGKGTTFIILLPVRGMRKAKDLNGSGVALSRPLRVLIVDDEPVGRQLLTEYLVGDGHTVETATNGREGLEKFRAGKFDLVVTDRAMPAVSGDQLAAAIKAIAPRPVILLTGFGEEIKASGEKPAGVDLILSKPVTLSALREAVAAVTGKKMARSRKVRRDKA